ncbi:MAG: hypothetical protein HY040_07685 [Planctomycetes bacterium]|nr:hypothetical protein [Planctomycetota bacterium]
MRKRWSLTLALVAIVVTGLYLYGRLSQASLGEYYQTTLINKSQDEIEEIVGAKPNRIWKRAQLPGAVFAFDAAAEALGHWYTWKGTISVVFDKSGKAKTVNFDPSMRRGGEHAVLDHLFFMIGW